MKKLTSLKNDVDTTTSEVPSSHASPVSHPYEVAEFILHAAVKVR